MRTRILRAWILSCLLFLSAALLRAQTTVQSPRAFFGFEMGADRKLANWPEVVQYCRHLDQASDRILFSELGRTTLGKPFVALTVSSPENLKRLDYYLSVQQKLADPRGLTTEAAEPLIRDGKAIVLITCTIHSTEVASTQTAMEFLYRLATAKDEDTLSIR